MTRFIALTYGLLSYALFLATILYAIGFVGGFAVPKAIDTGAVAPLSRAVLNNLHLLALFAIQHSVMARKSFKQWWTRYVPDSVERSTYVLFTSLTLCLLFWQWQPIPTVIWQIDHPHIAMVITALSLGGWLMVFTSTFLISHFELFGVRQVVDNLAGRVSPAPRFRTPFLYNLVRHPIYLGFIIAFWATPTMTAGHLLFAGVSTLYILIGIALEERDLTAMFGDDYRRYRDRVSMLLPWRLLQPRALQAGSQQRTEAGAE
ncbi:methanethiol S-methyltransferase [Bradyrhizobium sp.]|uniref:methanethiol S-methyltransferase n=1 Tax=Bradyrhizobium sp. TaxID=376 RepID=UPI000ACAACEE|nr:methanethiol S-methyltransferase [Bradyrhizobium sp.]